MPETMVRQTTFVLHTCAKCMIEFAITTGADFRCKQEGKDFYCPNGHSLSYGKSEADRLRDTLAAKDRELEIEASNKKWYADRLASEQASHRRTVNQLNGTRGALTRVKRRVSAGRCPCCSNQFKDLERHMKNQHPKWDPGAHAEALAEKGE